MGGNCRHPMIAKWKLCADRESGKIIAIDVMTYIDGGCSEDFSGFIVGEMLENIESCYTAPHYRSQAQLLRTNTAANTAVRAPGLIQVQTRYFRPLHGGIGYGCVYN